MNLADNIRQRNRRIREKKQQVVEVTEEFLDQKGEELQEIEQRMDDARPNPEDIPSEGSFGPGDSMPGVDEEALDAARDELNSLEKDYEQKVEEETCFGADTRLSMDRLQSVINGQLHFTSFSPDRELFELEHQNYDDYHALVAQEAGIDENTRAASLGGGADYRVAEAMGGQWFYVDVHCETGERPDSDADITHIEQDLYEGEIDDIDQELDFVLMKTVGSPLDDEELRQGFFDAAYDALGENGILAATNDVEDERFERQETVEPAPEAFLYKIEGAYNALPISFYTKKD